MGALAKKVALVTGGGSGLGRAVVERFLSEGGAVVVLEKSVETGAALEKIFAGADLRLVTGDVRSVADNFRAVEVAKNIFGKLDIFVGNAGIYDNRTALEDIPAELLPDAFGEIFSVNVLGYLLGVRAAMTELKRNGGTVVLTASVSSYTAGFGGALYIASKHAVAGLVRQLAWELGPDVYVNGVAPGYVPTGLSGLEVLGQKISTTGPKAENLPLHEIRTPEDHANLYAFLASEAGRISTGAIYPADGGLGVTGPAFKGWS